MSQTPQNNEPLFNNGIDFYSRGSQSSNMTNDQAFMPIIPVDSMPYGNNLSTEQVSTQNSNIYSSLPYATPPGIYTPSNTNANTNLNTQQLSYIGSSYPSNNVNTEQVSTQNSNIYSSLPYATSEIFISEIPGYYVI